MLDFQFQFGERSLCHPNDLGCNSVLSAIPEHSQCILDARQSVAKSTTDNQITEPWPSRSCSSVESNGIPRYCKTGAVTWAAVHRVN